MMSSDDIRRVIEVQAEALGSLLHEGVATALTASHVRARGLSHERYPHFMSLAMRAEMREYLEANAIPNGWTVGGDPRKMGQLLLGHPALDMEMRCLKERRRTYPGRAPTAGGSEKPVRYWSEDPLDLKLPEPSDPEDAGPVRLLLLWDFRDQAPDQFTLRIVHTLALGVYGRPVPCDLIVDVGDGGSIYSHLKFPGSPEDDDFFMVDIEEVDENG